MIEKMKMMNLVAQVDQVDAILKDIVLLNLVHLEDAKYEIDESNFTICMLEENVEEIADMCVIKSYNERRNFKPLEEKLLILRQYMDIGDLGNVREQLEENIEFDTLSQTVEEIYYDFSETHNRVEALRAEKERLEKFSVVKLLGRAQIDLKAVNNMEFFTFKLGTLTAAEKAKLSRNYENISATVMHIGKTKDREVLLVVSPKELETETDRILRSVHFEEIEILEEYIDYPNRMIKKVENRLEEIEEEIVQLVSVDKMHVAQYHERVLKCSRQLELEKIASELKKKVATTRSFAYISGWVSEKDIPEIERCFEHYGHEIILTFREVAEVDVKIVPPTKLRNNWLFKPFEELVEMYGTPSYTELDPTVFFGLAYMLLFGAMFGDLGQGFIFLIVGMLLSKKMVSSNYGGILSRLGISSMTFGFFYDSLFGYEHVISGIIKLNIFLRPIENINPVLMASIGFGVVLLTMSFAYSIINKLRAKDYKEGLFGRNGFAGFVLFITLILIVLDKGASIRVLPGVLLTGLVMICVALIVVREPLANLITGKRPLYHESVSEYYVESGFDILETFLSILSNSVSFIRVGAFALNHVGLFIAFHTIANIIGNAAGDISMFIIGNLIVIFLEGLVVFIQGLRLVYYEMFSKYYSGDGVRFMPSGFRGN